MAAFSACYICCPSRDYTSPFFLRSGLPQFVSPPWPATPRHAPSSTFIPRQGEDHREEKPGLNELLMCSASSYWWLFGEDDWFLSEIKGLAAAAISSCHI